MFNISSGQNIWEKAQERSNSYKERLCFTDVDFNVIKNNDIPSDIDEEKLKTNGFLTVAVNDKLFKFTICSIYRPRIKKEILNLIQVFCTNDSTINQVNLVGSDIFYHIADHWHQLLIEKLQGKLIENLKYRISTVNTRNVEFWNKVVRHSDEICARLDISDNNFSMINDCFNGVFQFTLEDKNFELKFYKTCGSRYGGSWKDVIQVFCTNDPSLNETLGGGTNFINAISEHWHRLLIDGPQNGVLLELKALISDSISKSKRLWLKVQEHSDKICKRLGITNNELEEIQRRLSETLGTQPKNVTYPTNDFQIVIENKIFAIFIKSTCAFNYGQKWKDLIQIVCINDDSINEKTGRGTSSINVISENWLESLLNKL